MTQKNKINRFSMTKKLRDERRSNEFLELMIANLTLEELIALKLEVAYRTVSVPLYGFPIWKVTPKIVRDAMLRFALSLTGSRNHAAKLLGMKRQQFSNYIRKYGLRDYYTKEKGDDYREPIKTDFSKSPSG